MSAYFIGLMSGTSMDGIDAALVQFDGANTRLVVGETYEFESDLKPRLRQSARNAAQLKALELGQLDSLLGTAFAQAALKLLASCDVEPRQVTAIGSHGQTLLHAPGTSPPFTLQIADPNIIAAQTGITVVSDFRRKDMALGGQGAPLTPGFHRFAFGDQLEDRVVINIGGIANITVLPKSGSIIGFDTGPGNTLMDAWIHHCKQQAFDDNGEWASRGVVDENLLKKLKADTYFSAEPPKSTGPEYFNLDWLWEKLGATGESQTNIQALLLKLTVETITDAIKQQAVTAQSAFICGGGAHNQVLCREIDTALPESNVQTTAALGVHPDWVEAMTFAWLAKRTLDRKPGNIPSVTGALKESVLGTITPA